MKQSILLIYTGGTIGMKQDPDTLLLKPFNFEQITEEVPELKKFGYNIVSHSFVPAIDSSDVKVSFWIELAELIRDNYDKYDGFVVLHGTDTMAYSASALSFMLEDLEKPVIFTGSQLPIGMLRTDGKENLISSIEIAASHNAEGHPYVPEVCIYFENELYRGNRTTKYNAENFKAFHSANYPVLADVGIHIKYNLPAISVPKQWGKKLKIHTKLNTDVAILKIFPGINKEYADAVLTTKNMRALVLETFGSGNAPSSKWFLDSIKKCVDSGVVVVNVTQCLAGRVDMSAYANGAVLRDVGVVSGNDITTESAITKLFFLLGKYSEKDIIIENILNNIRGEISVN